MPDDFPFPDPADDPLAYLPGTPADPTEQADIAAEARRETHRRRVAYHVAAIGRGIEAAEAGRKAVAK